MEGAELFNNVKNNIFPIFSKAEAIIEYLFHGEELTDDEILRMCDQLGESIGAILSYLTGFNKHFIAKSV